MDAQSQRAQCTDVELSTLTPHPHQTEWFPDLGETALAELAADIDTNGLQCPIEILPDGTIVSGHQRVEACRQLGHSTIRAIVRDDLADNDEACQLRLIEANLNRRHQSKLSLARCYLRLKESARSNGNSGDGALELRDQLGKRFNLSGRTLDRYVQVLNTPPAVQRAVERGELSLTQGMRISKLAPAQQARLAQAIEAGKKPHEVLGGIDKKPFPGQAALSQLLRSRAALERLPASQCERELLEGVQSTLAAIQAWCDGCLCENTQPECE